MASQSPASLLQQASGWSIVWGVLLIIFGVLAVSLPLLAAVAVNALIAWLIILAGVVHLVVAFHAHGAGSVIWKLLVGLAYIVFGGYLLMHPLLGVASLTLLLASLFLIEGVLDIVLYFNRVPARGAGWVLFDGLVTFVLAGLIGIHWPSSSAWAIGTLVGVSMIMSGVARVMMSLGRAPLTPPATHAKGRRSSRRAARRLLVDSRRCRPHLCVCSQGARGEEIPGQREYERPRSSASDACASFATGCLLRLACRFPLRGFFLGRLARRFFFLAGFFLASLGPAFGFFAAGFFAAGLRGGLGEPPPPMAVVQREPALPAPVAARSRPALRLLLPLLLPRNLLLANRRRRRCRQIHPSRHHVRRGFRRKSFFLLDFGPRRARAAAQALRVLRK